jgi:deoxyribose-phosphate aldolase
LIAGRALAALDLTDLTDDCNDRAVDALLTRARTRHGHVAAVCIWPRFVTRASAGLHGTGVKVATVINFPHGSDDIAPAITDTEAALRDGADEIDIVIPYKSLMNGNERIVREMITEVRARIPTNGKLKTILETGELRDPEFIRRASEIAIDAGADFLKTSTGKTPVSATPEAARVMLTAIEKSGRPVGFKASGGIRTLADATIYLDLADEIMGPDWARPETFRFGASGLLDALLATLETDA